MAKSFQLITKLDGYFVIKLTIKVGITEEKVGYFAASFRYHDQDNKQIKWENTYKILRHKNGSMYIDSKNPYKHGVKIERFETMMPMPKKK